MPRRTSRTPLPIAAHPDGCHYRSRMIRCLDQIGRPWRITYSSPGISGLQQAVQSGLGVTALTRRTLLRGMRVLTEKDGFPPLADIHVGLHFKNTGASTAALMLVNHIMQALHDSGQTDFVRTGAAGWIADGCISKTHVLFERSIFHRGEILD